MEKIKAHGSQARDMFLSGAKTMAKVGEYPIHLITSKEVVKYVEKPVSTIKTWMKFTAVMLAAALLLWQLVEKIRSYVENPVIVNTEYSYVDKLPFPGLIVCNSQPLRFSKVSTTPFMKILNESVLNVGPINVSDPIIAHELALANQYNLREFYLNNSQPAYDFIVGCKWPSETAVCNDSHFHFVITDYGPCYRLLIPPEKWPNITAAGSINSLQLVLNVDIEDSFPSTSAKTVGAFVALYPFTDPTPAVSHIGFNAPPGFETSIAVGFETVNRLRREKKGGSCHFDKQLTLFQNYTTTGCYVQNQFFNRVNACSCLPYNLPEYRNPLALDDENLKFINLLNSSRLCNAEKQFSCVDDQWEMDAIASSDTEMDQSIKFACPDACKTERYSNALTYSLIAANQLRLTLSKEKRENITANRLKAADLRAKVPGASAGAGGTAAVANSEMQYYKENFVILNIYFKELVSTKISQNLMYDGLNFAGDIAGTIGIILGFLLTTLGDVVENCHMLYKKVRGVIDPGLEKVVKIIEKEERVRPEGDHDAEDGKAANGHAAETKV